MDVIGVVCLILELEINTENTEYTVGWGWLRAFQLSLLCVCSEDLEGIMSRRFPFSSCTVHTWAGCKFAGLGLWTFQPAVNVVPCYEMSQIRVSSDFQGSTFWRVELDYKTQIRESCPGPELIPSAHGQQNVFTFPWKSNMLISSCCLLEKAVPHESQNLHVLQASPLVSLCLLLSLHTQHLSLELFADGGNSWGQRMAGQFCHAVSQRTGGNQSSCGRTGCTMKQHFVRPQRGV